jgi:zinc transporter ZupT
MSNMNFLQYSILFFSLLIGGGSAFFFKKNSGQYLQLILSFSGAYIIGITALHLIPETFHHGEAMLGAWLLLGFFGQLVLEQLSKGIEHGHIHVPHQPNMGFVIQVMLGLSIHSFVEGMPLNTPIAADIHHHDHSHLLWGIILHEMPASFALVSLLLSSGFKKSLVLVCMFLYASMSSLGALTAQWLSPSPEMSQVLMAVVIGTFLHISTTILFEVDNSQHHKISYKKLLVIALGIGVSLLTLL